MIAKDKPNAQILRKPPKKNNAITRQFLLLTKSSIAKHRFATIAILRSETPIYSHQDAERKKFFRRFAPTNSKKKFLGVPYLMKEKSLRRNTSPCQTTVFAFYYIHELFHADFSPADQKQCADYRSDHVPQKTVCLYGENDLLSLHRPFGMSKGANIVIDLRMQLAERSKVLSTYQLGGCKIHLLHIRLPRIIQAKGISERLLVSADTILVSPAQSIETCMSIIPNGIQTVNPYGIRKVTIETKYQTFPLSLRKAVIIEVSIEIRSMNSAIRPAAPHKFCFFSQNMKQSLLKNLLNTLLPLLNLPTMEILSVICQMQKVSHSFSPTIRPFARSKGIGLIKIKNGRLPQSTVYIS